MARPHSRRTAPAAHRRRSERLPLSAEHTLQRPCASAPDEGFPTVTVRSPSRQLTIFRKRLEYSSTTAQHGDVVRALLPDGSTLGYGTFNPRAQATLRMLSWGETTPGDSWWTDRLQAAFRLRRELDVANVADAFRLVHAEGDGLPGLVADRFSDIVSVEVFTLAMYQRSEDIARRLATITGASGWVVRPGPQTVEQEGFAAEAFGSADVPQRIAINEGGIRFEVDLAAGHKTGFFCDQRENRRRLGSLCAAKSVLDLCCYSGGFSLHAAVGGKAREVIGVDLDEQAVALARRNANLNQAKIRFVHADSFSFMRDMQRNGRTFEVVVLDPPKLIRGRDEYDEGARKYYDFNRLAASLVAPGGMLVTCSCSGLMSADEFTRTVTAAVPFDRSPQLLARTGAASDHPVALNAPESEYLKCLWLRLA